MFPWSFLLGSYEVDEFLLRMNPQFLVYMTNVHLRGVSRYAQVVSIVEISLLSDRSLNTSISRGASWHVCAIASSARSVWSSHMASNSICDVVLVCALMGAKDF